MLAGVLPTATVSFAVAPSLLRSHGIVAAYVGVSVTRGTLLECWRLRFAVGIKSAGSVALRRF